MKTQKTLKIAAISAAIVVGWNIAAIASTQEGNGRLDNIDIDGDSSIEEIFDEQVDRYTNTVNSYISRYNELKDGASNLVDMYLSVLNSEILSQIQGELAGLFGALGFPNSEAIGKRIPEIIIDTETENVAEFTLLTKKKAAINSSSRMLTEAHLQSRLSEDAQNAKKEEIESISDVAAHSVEAAEEAASLNITQDVLKQVAVQNADSALINRAIFGEMTQLSMNQTMTNHELHQILKNLEDSQWQDKINSTASRVSLADAVTEFTSLF